MIASPLGGGSRDGFDLLVSVLIVGLSYWSRKHLSYNGQFPSIQRQSYHPIKTLTFCFQKVSNTKYPVTSSLLPPISPIPLLNNASSDLYSDLSCFLCDTPLHYKAHLPLFFRGKRRHKVGCFRVHPPAPCLPTKKTQHWGLQGWCVVRIGDLFMFNMSSLGLISTLCLYPTESQCLWKAIN